jgi:tRNA (guanine37-N1)-methyltransferase
MSAVSLPNPLLHVVALTLFPEMFPGSLGISLAGKARAENIWRLDVMNIRDHATDVHKSVDDTPYGGGAGMVMKPDIVAAAIDAADQKFGVPKRRIYLSPRGRVFNQALAEELLASGSLQMLCGRYEGLDQRVIDTYALEEVSLGDFVLSGGEPAALAMLDAMVRLLPGVTGNDAMTEEESFARGLLEYPHYTRPPAWRGQEIPAILASGHHEKINQWRLEMAENLTKKRRPDLYEKYLTKTVSNPRKNQ